MMLPSVSGYYVVRGRSGGRKETSGEGEESPMLQKKTWNMIPEMSLAEKSTWKTSPTSIWIPYGDALRTTSVFAYNPTV